MADFVINEWIWADSSGDNGVERQRQAYKLITRLARSEHRIVIIEGSAFDAKAWSACKSNNTIVRSIARACVVGLRQNSERCLILKPEQVAAVREDLAATVKPDDRYLVQAQLTVPDAILVTTDGDLHDAVLAAGLKCLYREEFLSAYFAV